MTNPTVKKGARLVGPEREKLQKKVVTLYNKKMSIRAIADEIGRSYGNVHQLLADAGVDLRPRGGAQVKGKR